MKRYLLFLVPFFILSNPALAQSDLSLHQARSTIAGASTQPPLYDAENYTQIPVSQIGNGIDFHIWVENIGSLSESGVNVTVDLVQIGVGPFNSFTSGNYTLAPGDTTGFNTAMFPTAVGLYEVTYTINYPNSALDLTPSNNVMIDTFEISNYTFSCAYDIYQSQSLNNSGNPYTVLTKYYIDYADTIKHIEVALDPSSTVGETIIPVIYGMEPVVGDLIQLYDGTGNCEHVIQSHEIVQTPGDSLNTICLCVVPGVPVDNPVSGQFISYFVGYKTQGNVSVVMDTTLSYPTSGSLSFNSLSGNFAGTSFSTVANTAYINAIFGPADCQFVASTPSIERDQNLIHIFPIPADDVVNIDPKGQVLCSIRVYDLAGALILEENKNSINVVELEVENLAPGTYLLECRFADMSSEVSKLILN